VASKSNRQRKLERARAERRLARRAEQQRRKRQVQAAIGGAVALIVIALGTTWLLGGFSSKPEPVALPSCTWTAKPADTASGVTDTGSPPTSGEQRTGTELLTIKTNLGDIQASMDLTRAPCTAASMKHLGSVGYYDGVNCSHLDTSTMVLLCGDPQGDGRGGPNYQFPSEDIPTVAVGTAAPLPSSSASPGASASPSPSASAESTPSYYSKGMIVLNNTGPNANGGQFFIVYGDGSDLKAEYSIVGTVVSGLDLVESVAAGGAVDADGAPAPAGKPAKTMTIQQLFVGAPPSPSPEASASAGPSTSPTS
jgi:peptidyl-prolyl cis-trans isomerase B (cyclophilin B)